MDTHASVDEGSVKLCIEWVFVSHIFQVDTLLTKGIKSCCS